MSENEIITQKQLIRGVLTSTQPGVDKRLLRNGGRILTGDNQDTRRQKYCNEI